MRTVLDCMNQVFRMLLVRNNVKQHSLLYTQTADNNILLRTEPQGYHTVQLTTQPLSGPGARNCIRWRQLEVKQRMFVFDCCAIQA